MRDEDRKRFGDLIYEAWLRGRNPDCVDCDRYDMHRAEGYYPDEITVDMVCPKPPEPQPEGRE